MNCEAEKVLIDSKLGGYSSSENVKNFVGPGEITVQITLMEYRELVRISATVQMKIDEANKDKYTRESEIKDLQKKIEELRNENSELKAQLYELTKTEAKTEEPEDPEESSDAL